MGRALLIVAPLALAGSIVAGAFLPTEPPNEQPLGAIVTAGDFAFHEVRHHSVRQGTTPLPLLWSSPEKPSPQMERLRIPAIAVDASVVVAGRDERGSMVVPPDARTVVWYDFSSRPGTGGNAVFSGHFDYAGYGPAVFWDLRKLRYGDHIDLILSDGSIHRYQVVSSQTYPVSQIPVMDIIGPTAYEAITLITCAGRFDPSLRQYDERLIVRAQRVFW